MHAYWPAPGRAMTLKGDVAASTFLKSSEYESLISRVGCHIDADSSIAKLEPVSVLAHSRLVTNGAAEVEANNQPVRYRSVTVVHNGIVVNVDELWRARPSLRRCADVDTEIIAAILDDECDRHGDPMLATVEAFRAIRGAASIGWVHDEMGIQVLATNTGDLYHSVALSGLIVFASERFILSAALQELRPAAPACIHWLKAGQAVLIDIETGASEAFGLADPPRRGIALPNRLIRLAEHVDVGIRSGSAGPNVLASPAHEALLRYDANRIRCQRRCSRCVLPESFPFIDFDVAGVCNFCRNYQPRYRNLDPARAKSEFLDSIARYRRENGDPDVLVPFSGGRDSSFGLHLITREFGFNPITFTYDWGMVTDLARRNVSRLCGALGVPNILVSADIKRKRDNIRRNVSAWLNKPELGMVPLFMAGDKHFFSIVNVLKKQTGIKLDLWCANPLENTDFKSGFCGVSPDFGKARLDYLSLSRKARLALYYGVNFLRNPQYLNRSLFDTASAFFAYYLEPRRDFYFMFNHVVWNEEEVNRTLLDEYDWELSPDTNSTWRIGDGTAAFYNYIYVTTCGFSEFDTFRSNQIREGALSREMALELIQDENRPRPESLRWYLEAISLDFDLTISRVNRFAEDLARSSGRV